MIEPGVQRQPPPVRGLHPVGDHQMGVQLRVDRPAGVLTKRRRHDPLGVDHRDLAADPEPGVGVSLDPADQRRHRGVMRGEDLPRGASRSPSANSTDTDFGAEP